ncbi:MAG: lytic transglycosylase domain-containing protein [bacterium]
MAGFFLASLSFAFQIQSPRAEESHWLTKPQKKSKKKAPPPKDDNQLSEKGDRKLIHFPFPLPEALKPNFEFWKQIYSKYDKNDRVFHDTEHLEVIYSVIHLKEPEVENADGEAEEEIASPRAGRHSRLKEEKERIRGVLLKLAAGGYEEKDLSTEEKRIYHLFDSVDEPDKFKSAAETGRIRAQTGQKDKFLKAIEWSGAYLTEIEDVFTSYDLPHELTRIIFVESMFNPKARSKVGASGLWQFMPYTGRLFITVNSVVDERNDPIRATHAAAQFLKANFDSLGSWPLAVNAYNSGALNLSRAKEELGTDDIGIIAKNYRGGGYKFASRNFYTEFLAALEVANHYKDYFGEIERLPALKYETVTFDGPLPLVEVAQNCGIALSTLEEMNPGYSRVYFGSRKPLPSGYSLKIPAGMGEKFKKSAQETANRKTLKDAAPIAVQ